MFELKKIISAFLMPLPAFLLIAFVGLLLISFTVQRKLGSFIIFSALTGIFLTSFAPVSNKLAGSIERIYPTYIPASNKTIDYVMVLGDLHIADEDLPLSSQLSPTTVVRLVEGIRVLRLHPGAKLILSGYEKPHETSHPLMMANMALSLGVTKSDIVVLNGARDTSEEARYAADFIKDKNLVLITSASHMPRAIKEFNLAHLYPDAAPTDFLAKQYKKKPWNFYFPSPKHMAQTQLYWHETLGAWWQKIRKKINNI